LKGTAPSRLSALVGEYDNRIVLGASIAFIGERLASLSRAGGRVEETTGAGRGSRS
jgi:hypothetical protein